MLSDKDKLELREMPSDKLVVVARLFAKMATMPFQVNDQPCREAALSAEASAILRDRGIK